MVENKSVIKEILDIQKGLAGYTSINQLIVLTANRNYFYSVGERNQLYIDGGIYLMNLLYALHSYGIAACPAHWGLLNDADQSIERLIGIPKAAQVICIISFGYPKEVVKSTLSLRRKPSENLVFVEG
ncbi:MAG: nitroreductase family protein [Bacteroidales bacterium]|uniref:nitroreductase family protein n=1 Tax=Porphyromonas sp. TaxID=1924944 RepID=UPI002979C2E5|nr:nitroreductase family protein [Porphyromonas sp.]MDD7438338.1 nitroreductase family protein [Bacteroidales bacterium]MDY3066764.1 nitroreductase family protein [Porphyromonas sp.]